jgi:hypothetical protein
LKMEEWVLEVENAVAKATGECSISWFWTIIIFIYERRH